jgi:hypothetical protein
MEASIRFTLTDHDFWWAARSRSRHRGIRWLGHIAGHRSACEQLRAGVQFRLVRRKPGEIPRDASVAVGREGCYNSLG